MVFNRRERQALLCLAVALCIGSAATLVDYWRPQTLEEFSVLRAAVEVEAVETPRLHGSISIAPRRPSSSSCLALGRRWRCALSHTAGAEALLPRSKIWCRCAALAR